MIYLYALIAMSAINPADMYTVRYFETHSQCLVEKHNLQDNNRDAYIYDCVVIRGDKQLWRLWAKALGEKAGNDDKEADTIAIIRTIIVILYLVTNLFIVAGVIHHW